MEPCVNEEPKRNYFDIAPLLRQHENKLRREIVQLTIRLDSSSGRKKKHDSKREQKHWEQLRNSILDAQQGGALSYSLPNLEQIEQVVLNKRLSSSDVRSMLPEGSVSQADEEVDEGFRTPVSVCASGYASGCSSPQSLKSPKSDAVLADPGTSGRPSSAMPSYSSCTALVQRWRSPDHSPKPSEERKRLVQSPVRIPEAESRSRSPVRQREAGASSEGTAHRYRHSCHSEQDQERQSEAREEESAEIRRSAVTLEEMHASLDRLTRILREIALLINVSPAQRERLGEAHRQRPSRSLASMRISGLTRSISRQHSPSLRESLSLSGSQAPPVRESGHPARPVSSRDTTCVTPSDNEEGRESHRQKGKHPKVRRRQGQHSVPQTHVMLAPRRASENEVVIQSVSAVTSHVPSDFDSASGSEDVSSLSSKSGSDSEISISLEADSGGEERNRVVPKDRPARTSSRPASVRSDDERTLLSSQARSPEFFEEHPPFLPHDALPADHGAFEAASLQEDEDYGRLSPGEVPFSSEGPVPLVEPTFPVLEMQGGGQGRGFRGIARGSCWSDPGHFGSEPLNVENFDDDVDAFPLFRSADDRLSPSGIPLEQGARDEDMSQHIWRWANSETGRVIDEAAMRRLELFKTTYGGNIDGQPPHMKSANLRLSSTPKRVGQRMCQVEVVCIITPIAEETNSEPTSTSRMQAARATSLPERKAQ
ncbi:uncharacterized protein LOC142771544 [Rhipicephalus microplus]|uniref:uncharacterized protein LOC142771544 n=1 Tax=Rhipicephalus microplus TaxID=6941 RepID=UPI003F6C2193